MPFLLTDHPAYFSYENVSALSMFAPGPPSYRYYTVPKKNLVTAFFLLRKTGNVGKTWGVLWTENTIIVPSEMISLFGMKKPHTLDLVYRSKDDYINCNTRLIFQLSTKLTSPASFAIDFELIWLLHQRISFRFSWKAKLNICITNIILSISYGLARFLFK